LVTVSPSDPDRSQPIKDLVSEAQRHALAQDEAYAKPQSREERLWAKVALAVALPVFALVVLWNVQVMSARVVPEPEIEAVDLARTLRIAVDEIESFREEFGRLPDAAEAADFLPDGAIFRQDGGGYELTVPSPLLDQLRYASEEDPDRWLSTIQAALEPGGDQ
jgi:hypothetical protein